MKIGGIYEIVNTVSYKRYIGSALHFPKRKQEHWRSLSLGKHINPHLQAAWNKYGSASFEFRPVMICAPADLLSWEQKYIDEFRPEYNMCSVAGSMLGFKHSADFRARRSAYMKGRKATAAHCAAISAGQRGRVLPPEHRAKISAARLGVKRGPRPLHVRAKISASDIARYARMQAA